MRAKIRRLRSRDGVSRLVALCGGPTEFGRKIGRSKSWVNTYENKGKFPAVTYRIVRHVARRQGYDVPMSMFDFDPIPTRQAA